jgi:hypothetical protein
MRRNWRMIATAATALAVSALMINPASAVPTAHHWPTGCDSHAFTYGFHEAGHLADITETATRCWDSKGNLTRFTKVKMGFDNTPAGSILGMKWSSSTAIESSSARTYEFDVTVTDKACVADVVLLCSPSEVWDTAIQINSPHLDWQEHTGSPKPDSEDYYPYLCDNQTCETRTPTMKPGSAEIRDTNDRPSS